MVIRVVWQHFFGEPSRFPFKGLSQSKSIEPGSLYSFARIEFSKDCSSQGNNNRGNPSVRIQSLLVSLSQCQFGRDCRGLLKFINASDLYLLCIGHSRFERWRLFQQSQRSWAVGSCWICKRRRWTWPPRAKVWDIDGLSSHCQTRAVNGRVNL